MTLEATTYSEPNTFYRESRGWNINYVDFFLFSVVLCFFLFQFFVDPHNNQQHQLVVLNGKCCSQFLCFNFSTWYFQCEKREIFAFILGRPIMHKFQLTYCVFPFVVEKFRNNFDIRNQHPNTPEWANTQLVRSGTEKSHKTHIAACRHKRVRLEFFPDWCSDAPKMCWHIAKCRGKCWVLNSRNLTSSHCHRLHSGIKFKYFRRITQ